MRGGVKKRRRDQKPPESYVEREYRGLLSNSGLISSLVRVEETDLHILSDREIADKATELVLQLRLQLKGYIQRNPVFLNALAPLGQDRLAPPMIRAMLEAGILAEVGPMAAVAGTVAEFVGKSLHDDGAKEIIVENGGDIFLGRNRETTVGIFAGQSPMSYTVGVKVRKDQMPCGVCTSSGTVGHSLSLGDADSVTVIATSTPLADAVATRLGNEVGMAAGGKAGIARALELSKRIEGVSGVVVICDELMGAAGDIELVSLQ